MSHMQSYSAVLKIVRFGAFYRCFLITGTFFKAISLSVNYVVVLQRTLCKSLYILHNVLLTFVCCFLLLFLLYSEISVYLCTFLLFLCQRRHYIFGSSVHTVVCPSVKTYFAWCDISVLSGGISMKLAKSIQHVGGHSWRKVFKVRLQRLRSLRSWPD